MHLCAKNVKEAVVNSTIEHAIIARNEQKILFMMYSYFQLHYCRIVHRADHICMYGQHCEKNMNMNMVSISILKVGGLAKYVFDSGFPIDLEMKTLLMLQLDIRNRYVLWHYSFQPLQRYFQECSIN